MGDLQNWSPEPTSAVIGERPILIPFVPVNRNSPPETIDCWEIVEQATQEIVSHVQPTGVTERRRKEVVSYMQRLIKESLGCEVFQFGSVPLKTYLPDGDIDLTVFGPLTVEEALAGDVRSLLEAEERNSSSIFAIKDVQFIRAEVKLVKCVVENIVVDISFNQLGGLCTLCFLEQVDRLIGKNNLFKRSIILIKAWCYYESRILGAHHGLISTYALETLVLYIFHLFHSSLIGPLSVLHKFLDYFSKFDWDSFCIGINGPIRISSLPELVAERPENGGCDLFFSDEFLRRSAEIFSVPSREPETIIRTLSPKHLNIVDPLRENNNLGRSVSKANFYRIRSAFNYGARKLGKILSHPERNLFEEIHKFFSNTWDRHKRDLRPDVQDPKLVMEPHQENSRLSGLGSFKLQGNSVEILNKELHGLKILDNDVSEIDSYPGYGEIKLPNLNGDYQSHMEGFKYGRWWFECPLKGPTTEPVVGRFQRNEPWEARPWSNYGNGYAPYQAYYPPLVNQLVMPGPVFGRQENIRQRGMGTYFPDMNLYRERLSSPSGRNREHVRSPRHLNYPVVIPVPPPEPNVLDKSTLDLSEAHFPALQGRKPTITSDLPLPVAPISKVYPIENGSVSPPEIAGFENSMPPILEPKNSMLQKQVSNLGEVPEKVEKEVVFNLKDDDFPPLGI